MKRLTGLHAGFLCMETATSAMDMSGLAIYDPSDLPDDGAGFGIYMTYARFNKASQ